MSFLKSLFGSGAKQVGKTATAAKQAEHKGFTIEARPYQEGGRYQTAGAIVRNLNGVREEYTFIRADSFASLDEAADFALSKGRQIVDEQGSRMFEKDNKQGVPNRTP